MIFEHKNYSEKKNNLKHEHAFCVLDVYVLGILGSENLQLFNFFLIKLKSEIHMISLVAFLCKCPQQEFIVLEHWKLKLRNSPKLLTSNSSTHNIRVTV